ncbi:MAG: DEAD/DEAH box helicase [Verrucomicrobiota bacterium]
MQSLDALQHVQLPDPWQTDAIRALKDGDNVVLDAPTGAGKTFVLEQVIESGYFRGQVIYTAPTRALANDKYAEWQRLNWHIGIITGDISENTDAPVLVGTLEAVHGHLRRSDRQCSLVAIDEYQWLADPSRGNHYEGFCMSLPTDSQLLLMSGSVANPDFVAHWLERLGRQVAIIRHHKRPVPLEEFDLDGPARRMPDRIQGFWARRLAAALWAGLGPVLVFAPHRKESERLAKQAARELAPPIQPLVLSEEQKSILGPLLTRLIEARVAFHHSGLSYLQRAGVIEPLAKSGQLRVVVSTLGLGSGINFSLRSVLITAREYSAGPMQYMIQPHELLQMAGRAGRRGLDDTGYLLVSKDTPRLSEARSFHLHRSGPLPWSSILGRLAETEVGAAGYQINSLGEKLFTESEFKMGVEVTTFQKETLPCNLACDTSRARLVRRKRRPFKTCRKCVKRSECLELKPAATPTWEWISCGILTKQLELTDRGRHVSQFLGPEGLAIAAIIEDKKYSLENAVLDLADLFGGERFCENEPRWSGRLAHACRKAYQRLSIEGWLEWGVPCHYGYGAADTLRKLINREGRKTQLTGEYSGVGDIDRLVTEWSSLLRQVRDLPKTENLRWQGLQQQAQYWLELFPAPELPILPDITASQRKAVSHKLRWNK